jgi:Ricin-type beta-trefoil lectin domain
MRRIRLLTAAAAVSLTGTLLGIAGTAAATVPGQASVSETTAGPTSAAPGLGISARGGALAASPAAADPVPFEIKNYKSGRCLGIAGGADDAPAVLWNCNGSPNQMWTWDISIVYMGLYARLVNGDGECLGVAGGSLKEGADIYGWSCQDAFNQFWTTTTTGVSGYYYIYNFASQMVVGVSGGSTANGAQLIQWRELTHPDQYWQLPFGA